MPPPQEAEMRKRYVVVLSEQERARLHTMIGRGVGPAGALTHARILLKANQGEAGPSWTDAAIGAALEVNPARALLPPPAGRGAGGPSGRVDLQRPTPGSQALDVAAAGRPAGGAAGGRGGVGGEGPPGLRP